MICFLLLGALGIFLGCLIVIAFNFLDSFFAP